MEDISILSPQIPTSVDDTTGLLRALQNGTEEVSHLLTNSCNLILECRCCKAVFRHAKNFHHHKLNVCRAYHIPVAPTYEQVLAFQKAAAAAYKEDRPSTIKQSLTEEELSFQMEILEESEADLLDVYDGLEELCGEIGSPEPGEVIDETDLSGTDDGMSDTIEEGEYIEDDSTASSPATPLSVEGVEQCDTSQAEALQEMDSSSDESGAISLPESPPDGHLNFPIFNDQLLESPTDHDYFGKGEKLSALSMLLPVAQME